MQLQRTTNALIRLEIKAAFPFRQHSRHFWRKSTHVAFHLEFQTQSVTLRLCSGGVCFSEERIAPAIFRQNLNMYLSNLLMFMKKLNVKNYNG